MRARKSAPEGPYHGQHKTAPEAVPGTQALERAFLLLKLIAMHGRRGARLITLCELSTLQRPTVHRILSALAASGFVQSDNKHYRLGSVLYELGLAAPSPVQELDRLRGPLQELASSTADTSYLVMRRGDESVCLAIAIGEFPIRAVTFEVGARRPLGLGAAGLALLASTTPEEALAISLRNERQLEASGVSVATLEKRLEATRKRGYALSEGTITEGVTGIATVVRPRAGEPFLAVSVAAISARMPKSRHSKIVSLLHRAAKDTAALVATS